jgi:ABC-2 type transport system ATP-binding protein
VIGAFDRVAKWYGQVIALVDVSVEIGPGVTGLLGPNGAGKSTFLKVLTGQLRPSQGSVRLLDVDPFAATAVHRRIGFLPEPDAFYDAMTGRDFIRYLVRLHGFGPGEAKRRADAAIETVGMTKDCTRKIRGYSKGMRQRIKLAQAIAHEPEVLILDEPLTGMDPVARRRVIDIVRDLGETGTAVIVSSHILHEVAAMTNQLVLLHEGRVRAWGTRQEIRGILQDFPHRIRVTAEQARGLAGAFLAVPGVVGVHIVDGGVSVETRQPDEFYDMLSRKVLDEGLRVEALEAEDVGLDAIFDYLVK